MAACVSWRRSQNKNERPKAKTSTSRADADRFFNARRPASSVWLKDSNFGFGMRSDVRIFESNWRLKPRRRGNKSPTYLANKKARDTTPCMNSMHRHNNSCWETMRTSSPSFSLARLLLLGVFGLLVACSNVGSNNSNAGNIMAAAAAAAADAVRYFVVKRDLPYLKNERRNRRPPALLGLVQVL